MTRGAFITLEGGEGTGKTTQIRLLERAFHAGGHECVVTREPGGTPAAEHLRSLLVEEGIDWCPEAETLLFYAARMEHIKRVIEPALAEGKIVLCDRFSDSTRVYQGIGKGVSETFIEPLNRLCLKDFAPDLTLMLDMNPAKGLERAHTRADKENRFEKLGLLFHERVREGFLAIAEAEPERCAVVNAEPGIAELHAELIRVINGRLSFHLPPVSV